MIDGKPAAQVLSGMREDAARGTTPTQGAGPQDVVSDYYNRNRLDAPENVGDIRARDARDRATAINAARSESSGNPSVTRNDVIDRINKQREAAGLTRFGDDIYSDIAKSDSSQARFDRSPFGRAYNTLPGATKSQQEGPLVEFKDISANEARKRRSQPMRIGGVEVPSLGERGATPKFDLRRPSRPDFTK
jgi:hypothetical protein